MNRDEQIEELKEEIQNLKNNKKESLSEKWGNSFLFGAAAVTLGNLLGGGD